MEKLLHDEFKRIVTTLTQTDPASPEYTQVLHNFECLDAIGSTINDFLKSDMCNEDCADCPLPDACADEAEIVEFPTPVPEPHDPPPPEPEPAYTQAEVRAKLAEARRLGVNVAAIVREFGVENFTAIPATKYGELLERVRDSCAGLE